MEHGIGAPLSSKYHTALPPLGWEWICRGLSTSRWRSPGIPLLGKDYTTVSIVILYMLVWLALVQQAKTRPIRGPY